MSVRGDNSLFFATGLQNDQLKAGAAEATGIVQGLANTIGKINPFAILVTGSVTAFATIAKSAYDMMRDFEQAMKEVETISKATQDNFKGISKEVFALSEISPDAPVELAKAYYQIVSAGYDGAKGLKLLETATKAATAGVTDTKTAADGITTVLNAFKISAEEADRVADIMFNTVKLGKTTFEELSSQLSQVAPLAAASGFSFEEVAAAVASLTKQGVPTAQAMTQIRSAIEATTEVLGDGAAKSLTLQNAFQAIYDKAGGSQNELKKLTGRMEAMNAILAITGPNAKGAASDLEAMGNAAGSAEEAFNRMAGSNVNEWQILRNRIKATTEELGNAAIELSSKFAGFFNDMLADGDKLRKNFDQQRIEIFKLEGALQSVNEDTDEFKVIRKQIIDQFPDFVSGIDLEKASTEDLLGVLQQVNDAYLQRFKFAKRQDEIKKELEKQGNIEINIEDAQQKFDQRLAEVRKIAEDRGIDLKIDYSLDEKGIFKQVTNQLEKAELISTKGYQGAATAIQETYNFLLASTRAIGEQTVKLREQEGVVENLIDKNRDLNLRDLKTQEGRNEALKQINESLKQSELQRFVGSGIKEIDEAISKRTKIIEQFNEIKVAKNIESLAPFLKSENEEIKNLAEERKRFLNTGFTGGGGNGNNSLDDFKEELKKAKEEYKAYEAVINQIGEGAAKEQFEKLLQYGDNYQQFLKGKLDNTTSYAKQQIIALEAEAENFTLNRPELEAVSSVNPGTVNFDFEIDQTSINAIQNQIGELNKKIRAALTDEERDSLRERLKYWEDRLDIAEGGVDSETALYQDIYRNLSDLTYEGIRDYIKYWKARLAEAEKGSKTEQEILGRISSAQGKLLDRIIGDAVQQLEAVSGIFREAGNEMAADMVDGLSSAANQLGNAFKAIESGSTYDAVAAGLGAAIELTGMLVSASAQRKKADQDYYNAVIAQQKEYNRLLNEELRTREGANENVFTTDYENRIKQGVEAYSDAQSSYMESLRALSEGVVQAGVRDEANIGNILSGAGSGAALGAAVGSIIPGLGTLIGGAVGAVGGALAGLFGGRTNEPQWVSLLQEYPELIQQAEDGQLQLNEALAETLLNQDLVKEGTRTLIEDTLAWQEAMEAAKEQIRDVISDLAGGLGDNLRNSLVGAFQAGQDAAIAMGDTVSNVLQDILSQLIFDKIFSDQFKRLEDEMAASFDVGGDRNWQDDFARFFEGAQGLTEDFNSQLEAARNTAMSNGFDIFGPEAGTDRNGLAGGISSITEDTAGAIEGYMNAVRIDVRQGLEVAIQSGVYLSEIAQNTRYNRYLESIDGRMATIENGILEFQSRN
ncbi:phage tail tape measure protein [Christiangramia forsetii]|uniref:Phage tail tape measure protein n=2 Tax=Christiangramia forsetii TaxID=411153 RepID=A0M437_CHRFK|nr:phage tail tape measure protein [Christiangramia forsetii]GGG24329.1 hypothetical protein GCM10011532_04460 [Christiangramia forsetii]CAL67382.1 phage tail tape measure protein [Christiangramia forsetii KT0803]